MSQSLMSFLLALLVEGITAIASYVINRLMRHMQQRDQDFGFDPETEYA